MQLPIQTRPGTGSPDKVILTVGNMSLTAKQFDEIADGMQEQYKSFLKGPGRKQFADQLVKVMVLAQRGRAAQAE